LVFFTCSSYSQFGRLHMIDVKKLTKQFGDITAVDELNFHVGEGEIFGFLGPNGAGKTITIRILCGLISKSSGEAKIASYEVGNDAHSLDIRKIIGLVPENVGLYVEVSAYENTRCTHKAESHSRLRRDAT
jgi:ABC-2 type transport system ATP-binding protein